MKGEAILLKASSSGDPNRMQAEASHPGTSVWVNASAGSGKTTILTRRVTRLLLEGVKPERILCITFTRAAAAEMAIRVTEKLSHWATCSDNELSADVAAMQDSPARPEQMIEARRLFARTLTCPGGMRIRTIHAFGQEILRRFPIEARLPPHFVVIEDADARALQEEALADLLRAAAADAPLAQSLRQLVRNLGEKGFRTAMRCVLADRARIEAAVAQAGGADKLIARLRAHMSLAPEDTEDHIWCMAVNFSVLPHVVLREVAHWLLEGSPSFAARGQDILAWLDLSPDAHAAQFDLYRRCFLTAKGDLYQHYANKDLLRTHPEIDTILRGEGLRLQSIDERLEAVRAASLTAAILALGGDLTRRYQARKAQHAALDYDDLIIRTDELLRRPGIAPWVLYKLDGGLDHILVDEAQDTSRAQWRIIASLAEEFFAGKGAKDGVNRTLFVVGDEKQSIFSFQRADPEAFAAMRGIFAQKINEAKKSFREMPLHASFRSAPAVLQAVDAVFARTAVRAGVSAEPVLHEARFREKIGRVELWPLVSAPAKDEAGDGVWQMPLGYEDEHDPEAGLAASIADKIAGWIERKEILSGFDRPVAPGDIMILLRRRRRFADLMVRALKQRKVPVTGVDRMHLIRQLPVMDLLALIQFALLPEDDLNLATVLRGPLLGLGEDQLMQLAIGRRGTLWHSLADNSGSHKSFATAHDYLARWLSAADFMTPFAMLVRLLNEACPGSGISGRRALWSRLGPDALDPVEELLNAAQNFSRSHIPSLQEFLHWLTAGDSEIKRELDRGGGEVRIMTVHAAKGLEAPIVFLPDTASLPRIQDVPELLWSRDGLPLYVPSKPGTGLARRLWDEARQKQMEEYRRLLYVALTRAANCLYIAGWETGRKEQDSESSWYNLAAEGLRSLHQPAFVKDETPPTSIVIADPVLHAKETKTPGTSSVKKPPLPAWVRQLAPAEPVALKTMAPSRLTPPSPAAATPDNVYARGRIIHRLLQSLPDMEDAKREDAALRFLANPQHRLTDAQQNKIKEDVMNVLNHPDYASLFGPESRAEVAVAGLVGGEKMAGQVDRLCVRENEIWIVDYKTNRPPPARLEDVPEAYRAQLAAYRAVLREIYPGKLVRCFLLWTYQPLLMELSDEILVGA